MIAEPLVEAIGGEAPPAGVWRSSLHTLASSSASVPIAFVTTVVIARTLGPSGKGSYDLVMATTMLLCMLFGLSLPAGLTYVVAQSRELSHSLAVQVQAVAVVQALVVLVAVAVVGASPYAAVFLPTNLQDDRIAPIVITVLTLLTLLSGYWRAIALGRHEFIRANVVDIAGKIVLLSGVLLAALLGPSMGDPATIAVIGVTCLATAIVTLMLRRLAFDTPSATLTSGGLGAALRYALPCYAGNVTQFLNYRLDIFIVSFFWGPGAVGLYALAVTTTQLVWLIPNSAAAVLFPFVAGGRGVGPNSATRTAQLARVTLLACAIASGALAISAGALLPLVYGDAFRASVEPLLWLLPGTTVFGLATVCAAYIAGVGKPRLNFYVALGGLAITVVLDLALIPSRGIVGAAMASSISYIFSAAVSVWLVMKESNLGLSNMLIPDTQDLREAAGALRSLIHRARLVRPTAAS
jgi:O-antigen/teichoic acid export membrane protein